MSSPYIVSFPSPTEQKDHNIGIAKRNVKTDPLSEIKELNTGITKNLVRKLSGVWLELEIEETVIVRVSFNVLPFILMGPGYFRISLERVSDQLLCE